MMDHEYYMNLALEAAKKAGQNNEVPIGAVVASKNGDVISVAHNQTIGLLDPAGHAEVLAIRQACEAMGNYRLSGAVLYSTIEPCIMCAGAAVHARIGHIVYGVHDPKWGGAGSVFDVSVKTALNHRPEVTSGILAEECRELIQSFFRNKRASKK